MVETTILPNLSVPCKKDVYIKLKNETKRRGEDKRTKLSGTLKNILKDLLAKRITTDKRLAAINAYFVVHKKNAVISFLFMPETNLTMTRPKKPKVKERRPTKEITDAKSPYPDGPNIRPIIR